MPLTEKGCERAKVKPQAYVLSDSPRTVGLQFKVLPTGKRVWLLQSVYPGSRTQARRVLGYFPALSLSQARAKAREWHALVRQGTDPQIVEEQRAEAAAAERRAKALQDEQTFAAVAERFIAEHLAKQRRGKPGAREVRNYLVREFGNRPIASITPHDIKAYIAKLKVTAPYQARNVYGHLGVLFKFAIHHDLLDISPLASLSKKMLFAGATIGPRQRVLDQDELRAFWRGSGKLSYPMGRLYQMLLLTGCRLNEIARAKWSELHPELRRAIRNKADWRTLPAEWKVLSIPPERFKSGVTHEVQLTDDALQILASLPRFSGNTSDYIFTTTGGKLAVNGMSKSKSQLDGYMLRSLKALARLRGEDPRTVTLKPFIIHDTRRCVRSHLSALNVDDHVAEMVLGHGRKGLQRTYDMHRYAPQIREALERWAARLREITMPTPPAPVARGNVVKLKARAS